MTNGYQYEIVNHQYNCLCLNIGSQTQAIEKVWSGGKNQLMKGMRGMPKDHFSLI